MPPVRVVPALDEVEDSHAGLSLRAEATLIQQLTLERSHRTDKDEFYQLIDYRDDVDLEKKLAAWERFYNYDRPHSSHRGKTPYEVLRQKLT